MRFVHRAGITFMILGLSMGTNNLIISGTGGIMPLIVSIVGMSFFMLPADEKDFVGGNKYDEDGR